MSRVAKLVASIQSKSCLSTNALDFPRVATLSVQALYCTATMAGQVALVNLSAILFYINCSGIISHLLTTSAKSLSLIGSGLFDLEVSMKVRGGVTSLGFWYVLFLVDQYHSLICTQALQRWEY